MKRKWEVPDIHSSINFGEGAIVMHDLLVDIFEKAYAFQGVLPGAIVSKLQEFESAYIPGDVVQRITQGKTKAQGDMDTQKRILRMENL
jgi:hypothetical protein